MIKRTFKKAINASAGTILVTVIMASGVVYALSGVDFSNKATIWAKANCTNALVSAKATAANEQTSTICYSYNKINEHETSITNLQSSNTLLNFAYGNLTANISGQFNQLSSQAQSILGLRNGFSTLSDTVKGLGDTLNGQGLAISSLRNGQDVHSTQIASINSSLSNLQTQQSGLNNQVNNLSSKTGPVLYDSYSNLIGQIISNKSPYLTIYNQQLNRLIELDENGDFEGMTVNLGYASSDCTGSPYVFIGGIGSNFRLNKYIYRALNHSTNQYTYFIFSNTQAISHHINSIGFPGSCSWANNTDLALEPTAINIPFNIPLSGPTSLGQ